MRLALVTSAVAVLVFGPQRYLLIGLAVLVALALRVDEVLAQRRLALHHQRLARMDALSTEAARETIQSGLEAEREYLMAERAAIMERERRAKTPEEHQEVQAELAHLNARFGLWLMKRDEGTL